MKQAKNITKVFFLWLAGLILVAHSFIPHHHHFTLIEQEQICHEACRSNEEQTPQSESTNTFAQCVTTPASQNHHPCHGCEFNAKTTSTISKISIDMPECPDQAFGIILFPVIKKVAYRAATTTYSSHFYETYSLRGPPSA